MAHPDPTPATDRQINGAPRRFRRWAAVFACAVVMVALYVVDARLKAGGPVGYRSPSAQWQVTASDLPEAWVRWRGLDAFEALRTHAPDLPQSLPVVVRKITGIRPTPERVRLWLGSRAVVAGDADGWSASFRPGLMMRAASLVVSPARPEPVAGDSPAWARCAWGWREGVVILASSTDYLDHVLADGVPVAPQKDPADVLSAIWTGESEIALHVTLADGLPVSMSIADIAGGENRTLHHGSGWSDALWWAAVQDEATAGALAAVVEELGITLVGDDWINAGTSLVRPSWEAALPSIEGGDPNAGRVVGVFNADLEAEVPQLEVFRALTGDVRATLDQLTAQWSAREHRWNDTLGWLYPLPGEGRGQAAAIQHDTLYLASHEHLMPLLLAGDPADEVAGVAAFAIQWSPFSEALSETIRQAAEGGLLPGYNQQDVTRDVLPMFEALGQWGQFQMLLTAQEGGGIGGQGYLALTPEPL